MFDITRRFAPRYTGTAQLAVVEHTRHILQTFNGRLNKRIVAAALDHNVEYDAVLVDGALRVVQHTLDPNEHFINVPLVARLGRLPTQLVCEARTKLQAPLPDRVSLKQFDLPEAQTKWYRMVPSDRAAINRPEAAAIVRTGQLSHHFCQGCSRR
jgi:hypothetical protein